jgi:hypothetical protein
VGGPPGLVGDPELLAEGRGGDDDKKQEERRRSGRHVEGDGPGGQDGSPLSRVPPDEDHRMEEDQDEKRVRQVPVEGVDHIDAEGRRGAPEPGSEDELDRHHGDSGESEPHAHVPEETSPLGGWHQEQRRDGRQDDAQVDGQPDRAGHHGLQDRVGLWGRFLNTWNCTQCPRGLTSMQAGVVAPTQGRGGACHGTEALSLDSPSARRSPGSGARAPGGGSFPCSGSS